MFLSHLFENSTKTVCIMPGGFHPFLPHHSAGYKYLLKNFSNADIFIASSNDTSKRPFNFKQKQYLAVQSGVPANKFIQVTSPYKSLEITQHYDADNTILIFALGQKDADRLGKPIKKDGTLSYFQPYPNSSSKILSPFKKHAYYIIIPHVTYKVQGQAISSASKVREMYIGADEATRQAIVRELYPNSSKVNEIKNILDAVLLPQQMTEDTVSPPKINWKKSTQNWNENIISVDNIPLNDIHVWQKFRSRKIVAEYVEKMKQGEPIDMMWVSPEYEPNTYSIAHGTFGGHHRYDALKKLGYTNEKIPVYVQDVYHTRERWNKPTDDLTESPENLKAWFGNSKVVDAHGNPLRCYHGTMADFSEFKMTKMVPYGFYFTSDPEYANKYTGNRVGDRIIPVYLKIENPVPWEEYQAMWRKTRSLKDLISKGYDGVITDQAHEFDVPDLKDTAPVFVVFSSNQIKSAIGNNGTYNTSTNITESPDFGYSKFNDREQDLSKLHWDVSSSKHGISISIGADASVTDSTPWYDDKIFARIRAQRSTDIANIGSAYIKSKWSGTGLGQMMYDKLISVAKNAGYRYVRSDNDLNEASHKAWARLAKRYPVVAIPNYATKPSSEIEPTDDPNKTKYYQIDLHKIKPTPTNESIDKPDFEGFDDACDYFMNEACGTFALGLAKLIPGSQIYILSRTSKYAQKWSRKYPFEFTHVFVETKDGKTMDCRGSRSIHEIADEFNITINRNGRIIGPFTAQSFQRRFIGNAKNKPLFGNDKGVLDAIDFIRANNERYGVKKKTTNESYSSPIRFHDELNPKLWNDFELRPEVKKHLIDMSDVFIKELQLDNIPVVDIEISGSNAAYTYSKYSDIDLHVVVNVPAGKEDFYRNYFDAKKNLFNDQHNLKIRGISVELYVQFKDQPFVSNGIFSLINQKWIKKPVKQRVQFNDRAVRSRTHYFSYAIADVLKHNKCDKADKLWNKIKEYRKNGLTTTGEFGSKNLVFKLLRSSGLMQALSDFRTTCVDKKLNLESLCD